MIPISLCFIISFLISFRLEYEKQTLQGHMVPKICTHMLED